MNDLFSAYVNLLETTLGGGILIFPYLFKVYGIFNCIIITLIIAFIVYMTLYLLIISTKNDQMVDYNILINRIIPNSSVILDLFIFLKCLGVSIAYLIILIDLLIPLLQDYFTINKIIGISVSLIVLFPFCYHKNIAQLKYTSFISSVSIGIMTICCDILFLQNKSTSQISILKFPEYQWITYLGTFIFIFTCHVNFFSIKNAITENRNTTIKKASFMTILTASFIYLKFGISNYLLFGENIQPNVLNNYPNNFYGSFIKFLYAVSIFFTYPLQIHPCKKHFLNLIRFTIENKYDNFILTFVILLITFLFSVSNIDLAFFFKLVGSSVSTFLVLLLPGFIYLNSTKPSFFLFVVSYVIILFGFGIFIMTFIDL